MKIWHLPYLVGGNAARLAMAERELGYNSKSIEVGNNLFGYEPDERISGSLLSVELKRIQLLFHAIRNVDVIHFNFGESFFPRRYYSPSGSKRTIKQHILNYFFNVYAGFVEMKDVWLLSKLHKKIFVTFQGDDLRSPNLICQNALTKSSNYYNKKRNKNNLKRANLWCKYASGLFFLNPDLKQFLSCDAEFLPYSSVDVKKNLSSSSQGPRQNPVVVLHAPSSRSAKGTPAVINSITSLNNNDQVVTLEIAENLSNEEVLARIVKCDYVVDQLRVGWYGAFAVEAMSFGKPVVAWLDPTYFENVPKELIDDLPIISATEETLKDVLHRLLLESEDEYSARCLASILFVNKWHDPLRVAEITTSRYLE